MSYRYSSLLGNGELTEDCVGVVTRRTSSGSSASPTTPTRNTYPAAHGRLHGFLQLLSDRRSRRLTSSRKLDQNDPITPQSKASVKADVDVYYMESERKAGNTESIKKAGRGYKKLKYVTHQCSTVEPHHCTEILVS